MELSTQPAFPNRADRVLRGAVDPATIVAFATIGSLALAAAQVWELVPWVALVGIVAGWSSAWSP